MISLHFEDVKPLQIDEGFLQEWLQNVCHKEGVELGEVAIIFCSDEYLLRMNREYLNHDYYTDIITFDYTEEGLVSGDLFISIDRLKENAEVNNVMFHVERNRVVVHGVLHLIGYKDTTEEEQEEMTEMENWALSLIVSRET